LDRETPTPKKRKKRRHVGQRVARTLGLILALVVVGLVMRKVARPFVLCYTEARSVNEVERDLRRMESDNRYLRHQRAYLASREGARAEARKLGWVMPGERNLVIENPAESKRVALPEEADKQGFFDKLARRFRL
jgi:hypothetical protein